MRIQHNILAMNAYRNYNTNTSALAKNLEKLSSGYKINRAGDDAAGLAISEKMRAQITGLNAAQKNVKDGISLVKTAEGAMQEIQDMLNRMDYLATQSANGTYDNEVDRMNLNKEMVALKDEIDRIADSANFNGIKLLNGDLVNSSGTTSAVAQPDLKTKFEIDLNSTNGANATCGQPHAMGKKEQNPEFEISLREAFHNITASKAIASGESITVKVSINGATATSISVSLTLKGIGTAGIATGGNISKSVIENSIKNGGFRLESGGSSVKIQGANGTVSFNVSIASKTGILSFKGTGVVKDIDCNFDITVTGTGGGIATFGTKHSFDCQSEVIKNGVAEVAEQLAHAHFTVTSSMASAMLNGSSLMIDGQEIKVNDSTTETKVGQIGVKDLVSSNGTISGDNLIEFARRITVAAAGSANTAFRVGLGSTNTTQISLQEKVGYHDGDDPNHPDYLDAKKKFQEKVYLKTAVADIPGQSYGKDGGLVLQIGDTSDSFNQLKVNIGDMHVNAMGPGEYKDEKGNTVQITKTIENIDITTASHAAEAIQVIKNAINYVSSIRGDLGAIQNRLEHTANNLSVMAENIQDAESTIRDTDIAEEMMSYTKNNILVQSAQAMLAQANAVPQGVLQLLG